MIVLMVAMNQNVMIESALKLNLDVHRVDVFLLIGFVMVSK